MEGGAVGHNFEMGLPKDYPCQVWFNDDETLLSQYADDTFLILDGREISLKETLILQSLKVKNECF
jgi:hypothetical protein